MMRLSTLCLLPVVSVNAGALLVNGSLGYSLGVPGTSMASKTTATDLSDKYEVVKGSFADGLRVGLGLGYEVNPALQLHLGARYEASSEVTSSSNTNTTSTLRTSTGKMSTTQIALIPGILVALPGEGLRPYVRLNGHLGFPTLTTHSSSTTTRSPSATSLGTTEIEWEYTGGLAWGVGGGIGIELPLSDRLSLMGELVADNWTWGQTEGKKTKHLINGIDILPTQTKSETTRKYVDSYSIDNSGDRPTDEASKSLATSRSYSALGLNAGIQFKF